MNTEREAAGWSRSPTLPGSGERAVGVNLIQTSLFCTGACGVAYAELCLEKRHLYVKATGGQSR